MDEFFVFPFFFSLSIANEKNGKRNPNPKTKRGTQTQHTVRKVNIKLKRSFKLCTRCITRIWSTPILFLDFCFVICLWICVPLKAINFRLNIRIYGEVKTLRKNCSYHVTMHHHLYTHTPACTLHIDKAIHIERTERNDTQKKTET